MKSLKGVQVVARAPSDHAPQRTRRADFEVENGEVRKQCAQLGRRVPDSAHFGHDAVARLTGDGGDDRGQRVGMAAQKPPRQDRGHRSLAAPARTPRDHPPRPAVVGVEQPLLPRVQRDAKSVRVKRGGSFLTDAKTFAARSALSTIKRFSAARPWRQAEHPVSIALGLARRLRLLVGLPSGLVRGTPLGPCLHGGFRAFRGGLLRGFAFSASSAAAASRSSPESRANRIPRGSRG